jgi:hypothetical protein
VTHFASLREVTPRVDDAKVRKRMRRHRHLSVRPLVQPLPARPRRTDVAPRHPGRDAVAPLDPGATRAPRRLAGDDAVRAVQELKDEWGPDHFEG